jgi:hypothetical protein
MEVKDFKWALGSRMKDKVTGFIGIVVCQSRYLTGCNRYSLQSPKLKDNKPADWHAFDEDQIELCAGKGKVKLNIKKPGGAVEHEAPQR